MKSHQTMKLSFCYETFVAPTAVMAFLQDLIYKTVNVLDSY